MNKLILAFCLSTIFALVLISLGSSTQKDSNGPVALFPDKGQVISATARERIIKVLKHRFPTNGKPILVHFTAICTSCSLGPNLDDVGERQEHLQVLFVHDYVPVKFPEQKKVFVISDPTFELVAQSENDSMPATLFYSPGSDKLIAITNKHKWSKR